MRPISIYHAWTTGSFTVSATIPLDWTRRYLVTAFLTQTEGDEYAHVYISQVCHYWGSDYSGCGIRDIPDNFRTCWATEILDHATSVTIKLTTRGGRHMAEGVVYEL